MCHVFHCFFPSFRMRGLGWIWLLALIFDWLSNTMILITFSAMVGSCKWEYIGKRQSPRPNVIDSRLLFINLCRFKCDQYRILSRFCWWSEAISVRTHPSIVFSINLLITLLPNVSLQKLNSTSSGCLAVFWCVCVCMFGTRTNRNVPVHSVPFRYGVLPCHFGSLGVFVFPL